MLENNQFLIQAYFTHMLTTVAMLIKDKVNSVFLYIKCIVMVSSAEIQNNLLLLMKWPEEISREGEQQYLL